MTGQLTGHMSVGVTVKIASNVHESHLDKISGNPKCIAVKEYWNIYLICYTVDSVLYSFGPFTLMFITNFAIVFKFMTAKCKSDHNSSTESTNQAIVKVATRGTTMVVTVSVTFIVLTAPSGVEYAVKSLMDLGSVPEFRVLMNITMYLNHSINGILYCIVGSRFRSELSKLICSSENSQNLLVSTLSTTLD